MSDKIYIQDQITVRPGALEAFRSAYLGDYAKQARERGMTLESVRLSPPFEWREGTNTLHILWSVPSVEEWWSMRIGGVAGRPLDTAGDNLGDWWASTADLVLNRRRDVLVDF